MVPVVSPQLVGSTGFRALYAAIADPERFACEPKVDGVRGLISFSNGHLEARNRRGIRRGWLRGDGFEFGLRRLAERLPILWHGTVLDGELTAGRFSLTMAALQGSLAYRSALRFVVFDVPVLAGVDLRGLAWAERRERLELVAQAFDVPFDLSPVVQPSAELARQGNRRAPRGHRPQGPDVTLPGRLSRGLVQGQGPQLVRARGVALPAVTIVQPSMDLRFRAQYELNAEFTLDAGPVVLTVGRTTVTLTAQADKRKPIAEVELIQSVSTDVLVGLSDLSAGKAPEGTDRSHPDVVHRDTRDGAPLIGPDGRIRDNYAVPWGLTQRRSEQPSQTSGTYWPKRRETPPGRCAGGSMQQDRTLPLRTDGQPNGPKTGSIGTGFHTTFGLE